jgi:glycosyltransferase involved in cell wall biosynthesis
MVAARRAGTSLTVRMLIVRFAWEVPMKVARRVVSETYAYASLRTSSIRCAQRRLAKFAMQRRRFVICIPYLKSGGGERVAANLAHALSHLYGPDSVAVLVTDWSGFVVRLIFPENVLTSYPPDVPILKIVSLGRAPYDERVWNLMTALMSMRPEMVINVNSWTMWECYERFAPELSAHMRLGTVAFGNVGDKAGKPIGFLATHLERLLPYLDFVITDHADILEDLRGKIATVPRTERVATQAEWSAAKLLKTMMTATTREAHDLSRYLGHVPSKADWAAAKLLAKEMTSTDLEARDLAKFHCLYQYAKPTERPPVASAQRRKGRPQILWASRVSRVKFPELVPHIARLLPECDIHAFGAREIGYKFPVVKKLLIPEYDLGNRLEKAPNLYWRGPYKKFSDLPIEQFSAMLYTGIYDGLPNVLLEAGSHRIPIVAPSRVGGIGELIDNDTGWPVENQYDPREYAERLREVLASPAEAERRADVLSHIVTTRHSFEAFCGAVRTLVEGRVPVQRTVRDVPNAKRVNGLIQHANGATAAYP